MTSEFSLLLPVYARDDPAQLVRAFRSAVDEQTLRPTEALIVRDGPIPDALAAVVDQLVATSPVPTRVLPLPENVGLADALTAGLAECRFDVVANGSRSSSPCSTPGTTWWGPACTSSRRTSR